MGGFYIEFEAYADRERLLYDMPRESLNMGL